MCLCYKKQSSPFVAVLWHFPFHLSCSSDHQAAAQTFRCRYLEQPEHSLTMSLKLVSQTSLNLKRQTDILMGKDFNLFSISQEIIYRQKTFSSLFHTQWQLNPSLTLFLKPKAKTEGKSLAGKGENFLLTTRCLVQHKGVHMKLCTMISKRLHCSASK